jgi:hypothetical protein
MKYILTKSSHINTVDIILWRKNFPKLLPQILLHFLVINMHSQRIHQTLIIFPFSIESFIHIPDHQYALQFQRATAAHRSIPVLLHLEHAPADFVRFLVGKTHAFKSWEFELLLLWFGLLEAGVLLETLEGGGFAAES